jgi:formylglycine-generating enzyme required for sulfatase activity
MKTNAIKLAYTALILALFATCTPMEGLEFFNLKPELKERLTALIAEAKSAKSGVTIGGSADSVYQGTKWVTSSVMNALNNVIDDAQDVVDADNPYYDQIEGVTDALRNAIATLWTADERKLRPVTAVSWYDCAAWCNAYSEMDGKTPAYYTDSSYNTVYKSGTTIYMNMAADGNRLPTEAEWEYAARGADTGAAAWSYTYSGSNNVDDVAWHIYNAYYPSSSNTSTTDHDNYGAHPVGTKAANTAGIHNMSGNVWEWCWDWYDSISSGSVSNPLGASSGSSRVLRGGGWNHYAYNTRVSYRIIAYPGVRYFYLGFRLVCSVP